MPLLARTERMSAEEARGQGARLDPHLISFRALRASDLTMMHRWLRSPHVARWWRSAEYTYQKVEEEYVPYVEGREPVRPFVILHEDVPIGYIQGYRISHDEEYAGLVGVEASAGVDLFIGEADYLHRGLGGPILRRFLAEEIFSDPGVEVCVIGPEPKNAAAIRAYEKVGFRYFKKIQVPGDPEPEYLMKLTRQAFEESGLG